MSAGTLYIVSGPIGNLDDITIRALNILKSVDLVVSEDTRETKKLLDHFNITVEQFSYRDQNHNSVTPKIIEFLEIGKSIALVSDSGTPAISDPGFKLVRDVTRKGIKVSPIPGASAVITALSVGGLPTDRFTFLGFLPKSESQRIDLLKKYGNQDSTLIIYESPYRIVKLLNEILESLGDRTICIARELTKLHEQIVTDTVSNLLNHFQKIPPKGEFVVLIAKEDF